MAEPREGKVLSVQSHTVTGYVGNRSATFPLQLLGLEVDVINSVQFSNHTGYKNGWKGTVLNGEQLWDLVEGLPALTSLDEVSQCALHARSPPHDTHVAGMAANELLDGYSHLLTGYIGSESFIRTVLRLVERLRSRNPNLEVGSCVLGIGSGQEGWDFRTLDRDRVRPGALSRSPASFSALATTTARRLSSATWLTHPGLFDTAVCVRPRYGRPREAVRSRRSGRCVPG